MGRMYRVVLPLATVVAAGAAAVVTAQSQAQEAQKATSVTFHKEVLPILQKNCQTCHRPGSIAPMSRLLRPARIMAAALSLFKGEQAEPTPDSTHN